MRYLVTYLPLGARTSIRFSLPLTSLFHLALRSGGCSDKVEGMDPGYPANELAIRSFFARAYAVSGGLSRSSRASAHASVRSMPSTSSWASAHRCVSSSPCARYSSFGYGTWKCRLRSNLSGPKPAPESDGKYSQLGTRNSAKSTSRILRCGYVCSRVRTCGRTFWFAGSKVRRSGSRSNIERTSSSCSVGTHICQAWCAVSMARPGE